jgi:hypothetical protein
MFTLMKRITCSVNYVTHPPVVSFFFIGALGILVIEGQLVMLSPGFRAAAQALVAGQSPPLGVERYFVTWILLRCNQ